MGRIPLARAFRSWACTSANRLTSAVAEKRAAGVEIIDLVGAGLHENGLGYPHDRLQAIAADAVSQSAIYCPDPRGQSDARRAIAGFYKRRGLTVDPAHVILTPGTSVAYLYALRLLLNPGQEVMVPYPGYPLFDDLCTFAGVRPRYYYLREQAGRWTIDLDDLDFQCTPACRALVIVSPHNPLGTVLSREELDAVAELCRRRDLALIFDEVYSEFVPPVGHPIARPRRAPLSIVLNGFSKMLSLPGIKIGWMVIDGDEDAVEPFMDAVEYASDLFLPVSEVSQAMVAPLLATADAVSRGFEDELAERRHAVEACLGGRTLQADGGVYVCLPLSGAMDDDEFALAALEQGVYIHPGHFYGLPRHVVFTCNARPTVLLDGVGRLRAMLE